MIDKTIARRYAQAIFDIAREKNAVEKFSEDLKSITRFIDDNEDMRKIIYGRLVPVEAKKEIIGKFVSPEIDPLVVNFIYLVLDKARENYLAGIVDTYDRLAAEEKKIVPAQVKSAIPLTKDQVAKLEERLSQITGRNIKTEIIVEPALIGGLTVRIGDIVYDGSIAKQLGLLKEHLQHDTVGKIGVRQ
ncbi:MAG: ATP synthase F1 subunit delta [Bacillota bacterium]|jgi:F-type H+-transporting ATPase subunit delta|nr:ATP synthase F1 subunit delta [Clostridia bacterium]